MIHGLHSFRAFLGFLLVLLITQSASPAVFLRDCIWNKAQRLNRTSYAAQLNAAVSDSRPFAASLPLTLLSPPHYTV